VAENKELKVSISSNLDATGFNQAQSKIKDLSSYTDKLSASFKTFAGLAASLGAVTLFKQQITQAIDFADSLNKLSQKTGITADGLYSLSAAAKLSDVDFASLEISLSKFSKGVGEASMGAGTAKDAFERLGVSIKNQDGTLKDSFSLLTELSDKFQDMPDGASKATTAMEIFGKSGAQMIPLLNSGSAALKEYLGVMDNDTGKAAEAFNDSMTKIGLAFSSVKMSIIKDFSPSIQGMTEDIESVAKSIQSFSSNSDINYYETFKKYADDVAALGVALYGTPLLIKSTSSAFSSLSSSTMLAAAKMALYGNELESAIAKTHMAKSALAGLSMAFKTFVPTAALFAITEIFLNWDEITGKVYDNLGKISNFKIQEMIDKQTEYIKTLEKRKNNKEDSNGFLAFMGASWTNMDDNTLRFAKQELQVLESQIRKNQEKDKNNQDKKKNDYGVIDTKEFDTQVKESLSIYSSYYGAIGDKATAWAIKEHELREKNKILSEEQINSLLDAEKKKYFELSGEAKKHADEAKKLAEETAKFNDEQFALLAINSEKSFRQLDAVKDFAEVQKEADKIAINSIKSMQDAMITYYEAIGDTQSAYYAKEAKLIDELKEQKLLTDTQINAIISANREKFRDEQFEKENKWLYDMFDNINKALDESFFDTMTGKFKSFGDWLKGFFGSIGGSIARGLSRTLAGSLTDSLQGGIVNSFKSYGLFGGASLVGSTLSASDMNSLISSGATASGGKITTGGGTIIDQASGMVTNQGSDAMSLLSTASSLKTAYGMITTGISDSIITGFQSASGLLANMGFGSAASGMMSFGAGVANPFAYAGMAGLPTSMTVGSALSGASLGGIGGYLVGSLGDKIFGADTYAGTAGAIGGALGGLGASLGLFGGPIGIIAGSLLGSVLGGLFGKKKVTGQGIDIFGNATADDVDGRYYTSYKKKSWFSSKSWENYTGFNAKELEAIKQTIGAYDYLLTQLGEYNDLVITGGRFSNLQSFLDTNVVKTFLGSINPQNLDTIYQSWVDYAAQIDKTITEAISTAVGGYTTYKRGYTEWFLGSGTTEQLEFTANYLQKDFEALASSLGASSVTVDNFLSMYDEAIKSNFTQDTMTSWASLGDALMKATDANKKYKDSLTSLNATLYPQDMMLNKGTDGTKVFQQIANDNATMKLMYAQMLKTMKDILTLQQFGATA